MGAEPPIAPWFFVNFSPCQSNVVTITPALGLVSMFAVNHGASNCFSISPMVGRFCFFASAFVNAAFPLRVGQGVGDGAACTERE